MSTPLKDFVARDKWRRSAGIRCSNIYECEEWRVSVIRMNERRGNLTSNRQSRGKSSNAANLPVLRFPRVAFFFSTVLPPLGGALARDARFFGSGLPTVVESG